MDNNKVAPNYLHLLSATVIQGLKNLCTVLSPDLTKTLILNSLKLTLHPGATITPVPELYASNADKAKQSEYAVVALYAVATKYCWDSITLRQQLELASVDATAIQELTHIYDENRKELILRQMQVGFNFPHIVDAKWRITCDVKTSTTNSSSGVANFYISLGSYRVDTGQRTTIVEFLCNMEELQSFVNRLKEIERHCEKTAAKIPAITSSQK